MKIFSNFDTGLKQRIFSEYQVAHGNENVLCFGRSMLYRIYKVVFPFLLVVLFGVLGSMFFYYRFDGNYFGYIAIVFGIMCILFISPIVRKYIDYKMDFVIVIPNAIMIYDQWALFKRDVITISAQSIKTISVQKSWLFYSIFDNGDIVILTEGGDVDHNGESILRRIPKPEKRRNQIVKIVGIDLEANQNPIV